MIKCVSFKNFNLNLFKRSLFTSLLLINIIISFVFLQNTANGIGGPMPTDTRIKTFIYNPNEIFQVKFMVGYQSIIELQKGENVQMVTFGDSTPWSIRVIDRRIFLKATEPGVKTNMTIITDKRFYMLEISSNDDDGDNDDKITFVLRFFYPNVNVDVPPSATKLAKIALNKRAGLNSDNLTDIKSFVANTGTINSNYTFATKGNAESIVPISVFDNGNKTYFKFRKEINLPNINAINDDFEEIPLRIRKSGDYIYVNTVERRFTIRQGNDVVCIFNEKSNDSDREIAYLNNK